MVRRTMIVVSACIAIGAVGAELGLAVQQENPSMTLRAARGPSETAAQSAGSEAAAAKADATKTKPKSTKPSDGASVSPISLEGSLKPLVERFNAAKGKHRFVALLSPT